MIEPWLARRPKPQNGEVRLRSRFARLRRTRFALSVLRGCATRSPKGRKWLASRSSRHTARLRRRLRRGSLAPLRERRLVPLAGIEPALLAELDFESSASTNSATGASHDDRLRANATKPAEYSGRRVPVNPRRNRQIKVAFYRSSRSKHSGVNGHASTAPRPRDRRLHTGDPT